MEALICGERKAMVPFLGRWGHCTRGYEALSDLSCTLHPLLSTLYLLQV